MAAPSGGSLLGARVLAVAEGPNPLKLPEALRRWGPLAGLAAALVAGTWLAARLSLAGQMTAMEREIAFYRSTRRVDIPRLLDEFRTFVGSADRRLELERLKQEHARLQKEHSRTLRQLGELRRTTRLEERFSLAAGRSHTLLRGQLVIGVLAVAPTYADVSLAGAPENGWRVGEFRDLHFGGARYRLLLEGVSAGADPQATFRLDAVPALPGSP